MKKLVASFFAVFMLLALTASSYADSEVQKQDQQVTSNQMDEKALRQHLESLGIDVKTQDKLIAKLAKGEVWDSMNPDKLKAVESELVVTAKEKGTVKRHVFNDGSVAQYSLDGGTSYCGSGYCNYNNVRVVRDMGVVYGSFYANYTIIPGSSNADQITSAYNASVTTIGGSNTSSLSVNIPQEYVGTGRYAAEATLSITYTAYSSAGQSSYYLKLYVGQDTAWQGTNW